MGELDAGEYMGDAERHGKQSTGCYILGGSSTSFFRCFLFMCNLRSGILFAQT